MDPSSIGLLTAYVALILFSAFFSASETAFSTANRVRLKTMESNGSKAARKTVRLLKNYDRLLTTFLTGNNIVNIALTTVGTFLFRDIISWDLGVSAVVSTVITTVLVLVFGEITPKIIATDKAERISILFTAPVTFFVYLLYPLSFLFSLWKKLLCKLFKIKPAVLVTGDELKTYVETAESGGEINAHESKLIRSAIEFDDLDAYDIMTPRVHVTAVEENEPYEQIAQKFRENEYSRMPVYSGTIDSIIGIVHEKELFLRAEKPFNLKSIISPTVCVSKTMKISDVLRLLQKAKVHMAVVVDEFGGTSGIITLEDIIEELVGEIWDEHDEVEVFIKKEGDNVFIVDGTENLETMFEAFSIDAKEDFESISVGGFAVEQMGRIPAPGDSFSYQNLFIEVTKATSKKVVEVKVTANEPEEEDDDTND